jgi:WD40 repeat protein
MTEDRDTTGRAAAQALRAAHLRHASAVASFARAASARGEHMLAMLATLAVLPDPGAGGDPPVSSAAAAALREAWLNNRERHVLRGHAGAVARAFFTPGARRVVSIGSDGTIRLWQLDAISPAGVVLDLDPAMAVDAQPSPDGRWLHTRDPDGSARLWDLAADTITALPIDAAGGSTGDVTFSPDSRWMVARGAPEAVVLWDLAATPPACRRLSDGLRMLAFSPDCRRLATEARDDRVQVWDLDNPSAAALVIDGMEGVQDATFAQDTRHLVAIHTMRTSEQDWFPPCVLDATLAHDARHLVTINAMRSSNPYRFPPCVLVRWDVGGGHAVAIASRVLDDDIHTKTFSPGGSFLVRKELSEGRFTLYDLTQPHLPAPVVLQPHHAPIRNVVFITDAMLLTFDQNGLVSVWHCREGGQLEGFALDHAGPVLRAACAGAGDVIASAGADGVICLYGADGRGSALARWRDADQAVGAEPGASSLVDDVGAVRRCLAVDNDEPFATDVYPRPLRGLARLVGHAGRIVDLAFSADGKQLVSAGEDGTARVWDVGPSFARQRAGKAYRSGAVSGGPPMRGDGTGRMWLQEPGEGPPAEAFLGWFPPPTEFYDGQKMNQLSGSFRSDRLSAPLRPRRPSYLWPPEEDSSFIADSYVWSTPTVEVLVVLARASLTRSLTPAERDALGLPLAAPSTPPPGPA